MKGEEKLAEFEPTLADKKKKLIEVLHTTTAVKDALEEQLRERLQSIADQLKLFVETGVDQAQTAFKDTEDENSPKLIGRCALWADLIEEFKVIWSC